MLRRHTPASGADIGFVGIARAAAPLYLTSVAGTAAALVDTAVLGHHATVSLAAYAVAMAVFGPVVAAASGAVRGLLPFAAERGEQPEALRSAVQDGLWLALVVGSTGGALVAATTLFGAGAGVPEATLSHLGWLPLLLGASVLAVSIGSAATSVLIGLGLRKPVMRAGLAGTVTAVMLSPALVAGIGPLPATGLTGVGVAMLAANCVNAGLAHRAVIRCGPIAGRPVFLGRPRPRDILSISRVGVPLAGTVLIKFAALGLIAMAAARMGVDTAAVHSISISVSNVVFVAATSVGQAIIPLTANGAASGDGAVVRHSVRAGLLVAAAAVVGFAVALLLTGNSAIAMFTSDPVVSDAVAARLPLVLLVILTDSVQVVVGFALIGIKRTTSSLATFALCYGLLSLAAVPVADRAGLKGLWLAMALTNVALTAGQGYALVRRTGRAPGARACRVDGSVP